MITAIVVLYKSDDYLKRLCDSLVKQEGITNVIFMDNTPHDDSCKSIVDNYAWGSLPHTYVKNDENMGYGRAINKAFKTFAVDEVTQYYLIVNPDVVLSDDCVKDLLSTMESEENVAIVGGINIPLDSLGKIDVEEVKRIHKPILGRNVHMVSGSLMLVDRDYVSQCGGFDEDFFLYFEDAEFCYKALASGAKVLWSPAIYYHFSGASTGIRSASYEMQKTYFHSELMFYTKIGAHGRVLWPLARATINTLFRGKNQWGAFWAAAKACDVEKKKYPVDYVVGYPDLRGDKDKVAKKLNRYYANAS